MMKRKTIKKLIIKILLFFCCALFVDSCCIILLNKNGLNVADYISQNIKDCQKDESSGTVDFNFNILDSRKSWFYGNHEATTSLLNYSDKGNTFLQFSFNDVEWSGCSKTLVENVDGIGCAPNITSKKILDLELVAGNYLIDNYKSRNVAKELPVFHCIISESLSKKLIGNDEMDSANLIGESLFYSLNSKPFVIDGVCKDKTLANCGNNYFVVACYRAFDYINPQMVLKYRAFNDEYTNFTFFKNLFYSTAWQPPVKTNKNAFMIISCEHNDWIVEEAAVVFDEKQGQAYLIIPLLMSYLVFSFFSPLIINEFEGRKDHVICISITLVLFFGCFGISSLIVDKLFLFNRHLIGKPIDIILYELIVIILSFVAHFFGKMIMEKKTKNIACIDI